MTSHVCVIHTPIYLVRRLIHGLFKKPHYDDGGVELWFDKMMGLNEYGGVVRLMMKDGKLHGTYKGDSFVMAIMVDRLYKDYINELTENELLKEE